MNTPVNGSKCNEICGDNYKAGNETCEVNNLPLQNEICITCSTIKLNCTCSGGTPSNIDQCHCCGDGIENYGE